MEKTGQYYLLEKIAQGGMAEIYKGLAYDLAGLQKTVCIKKILPHIAASKEFIDMLVDEAKIAVKLSQGNIAQVYDLGKAGDDYFIVMEYVEGQTLSRIFKKAAKMGQRLPVAVACAIIAETASGLNYMHCKTDEEGNPLHIIHRDISPQNIMVSYSGTVKIIDFGIAKAAARVGHTESGIVKGKFAYMSPEQARGNVLDHRSDIFSLGVIFHELLAGKRLFKGKNNKETLRNVRRARVIPPSHWNPEIAAEIDGLVLKALSKDRRHRFPFASDLRDELLKTLHMNYPEFQPHQLGEYVHDLFREEMEWAQTADKSEIPTPHLILEKTQTSFEGEEKKPVDWSEFMLGKEWPAGKKPPAVSPQSLPEEESEEEEITRRFAGQFWRQVAGIAFGLLVGAGVAGFFLWRHFNPGPAEPVSAPPPAEVSAQPCLSEHHGCLHFVFQMKIVSDPPGAKIYLNDNETGKTTPATLPIPENEKQVRVGLFLENYRFTEKTVHPRLDTVEKWRAVLEINTGALRVTSEPPGAEIRVNGTPAGNTPLLLEKMKPGETFQIQIEKEGFQPYKKEVQIPPGGEIRVHGLLERIR